MLINLTHRQRYFVIPDAGAKWIWPSAQLNRFVGTIDPSQKDSGFVFLDPIGETNKGSFMKGGGDMGEKKEKARRREGLQGEDLCDGGQESFRP